MKQGKLIRRAVSAALAGCMMFTLSAPALAESTDALMQLSTGSYRSSSLLSEENSFPTTIKVNGKPVTEANISSILGSENTGKLSYDGVTNTLKSNGRIKGDLTIDAPGVNIELCNSTSGEAAVSGKLTVTNAQDVKVTAQSYVAVLGDVEISCDGKVEITSEESPTVAGDVTVKQASTVAISGESYGYHIVRGDVTIACPATVVIQNHGTGGMASSIVYSGGKYVYSDTVDGTPVDPSGKPIDAKANAVYITPKMYYTINSNDTAVIIKVDDTEAGKARPGQTIKAWAPNKDGWEFENWEATGIDLGKQVNKNWITFKMPESNVTLNPHYAKLHAIEVVNGTADITSAKEGTKVTVTANHRPGYEFARWVILEGEAELEDEKNKTATVTVKNTNVKVKAVYKELHGISIEGGSFTVNGDTAETAKMGDAIVATADSAPAGQKFSHWEVTGVDGLTEEQLKNVPLEFTMPRGEVTLKAVFKTLHKIDVKFSTADKDTAIEGETVKITAESRPGYVFDRWEVNNGDVAVAKKNEEETTFVMPDKPVTAVAKYKKLLGITVNSGKAYVEDAVTDAALKGKLVVIKADKIEGKRFDQWKIVSGNVILDNQRAPEARFTMPETAVEITALYNDLHAITVNNGTADVEKAVIGDTVKPRGLCVRPLGSELRRCCRGRQERGRDHLYHARQHGRADCKI